jgi:rod shape-determining protein MreD
MLRALVPFGAGVLWLLVATALAGFLPSNFPPPDVVLIVVISFGFQYSLSFGGGVAFLLGILQDVLSGGVLGLNALSKTVVFILTRSIAQRFYFSHIASKIMMVFVGGIVDGLFVTCILLIGGAIHIPVDVLVRHLLLQIVCTGVFSPLVLAITPQAIDFSERGGEDIFHYGTTKTRTRGI